MKAYLVLALTTLALVAMASGEETQMNAEVVKRQISIGGNNHVGGHQQIAENNIKNSNNSGPGSGSLNQNINDPSPPKCPPQVTVTAIASCPPPVMVTYTVTVPNPKCSKPYH
ncbi:uncharacterized protein VTP21DRAFT_8179 [Calcarisporiella thermophila]|uniref:uncharacterized protein n=1 Tax=Calcarisporiella thermophila TaxID=911321 RepID=UPI0037443912